MSDPSFFAEPVPLSLDQIAALTGAVLVRGEGNTSVTGVAALDRAGASEFSFVEDKAYWPKLTDCQALAVVCREADVEQVPDRIAVLTAGAPYRVFAAVAGKLFPEAVTLPPMTGTGGVSPLAHVDGSAELEPDVVVEAGAVIGPQVQVGSGTVIGPNAVIAKGCRIGRDCRVGAGAVLQFSLIGDRVILHPGVKLGQDGFGYSMGMKHLKIPQLGRLIIQDDVEIGANTTIDRGSLRDTVVGEGTKIDNLVQIGHNVVIGRHCVIVAEVGISGSAELGDYVVLGGKVAVGEHIKIGTGAQIAGTSAVNDDVPAGERWLGHPAVPFRRWMRERMAVRALANKRGSGTRKEDGKTSGEETAE